jgi:CelD/BcsL family acetyltransferase involved in cellulose biosynthesis
VSFAIEWIVDEDAFAALAPEWDSLLPEDARPFDLHCWHAAWWKAFGEQFDPAVCTIREDDGRLAGVFPLQRHGHALGSLANVHSNAFRPLAKDSDALQALAEAALAEAARLTLSELWEGDPVIEALVAQARESGMACLLEPGSVSPIVDTTGDLDVWVTDSHASWKKRLRRYRRKMNKDHEARFEIVQPPADLEAELASGFAVEASGWKGEAGTAIVSRPETEAFYRAVASAFHARGELRLSRIELDGAPVAFSFCIEHGTRLYSLKAGFDESFRKLVPGLVLQVSIVEACFERGLDAYELLGETTEWKAKLANSERLHQTLQAYRRSPAGLLRYGYRARARPGLRWAYRHVARRS